MKIAILDDYHDAARTIGDWSRIERDHEINVFNGHLGQSAAVTTALAPFDVLCVMRERTLFDRAVLEGLPNLKLIATTGMRNAAIDMACCAERGITVCGTGGSAQSTAELAWGLIIGLARHIPTEDRGMKEGAWMTTIGTDLMGKTLGVVGLGRLGGHVARFGNAFGMKVIAWSQNLTDEAAQAAGAERVEKDALFRQSDFISVHYTLSERSRGLVGAAEIAAMKPTAYIVNTSRGPIIETDALVAALKAGRIGGAGIDTYDIEPLPSDHPLRGCPRTILTPHLGYVTEDTYKRFYTETAENVEAWLAGNPVRVIKA